VVQLLGVAIAAAVTGPAATPGRWPGRMQIATERTVLVYRRGELDDAQAREFADLLDQGVVHVRSLVAPSLPGGTAGPERVRFVVTSRVAISRSFRTTVFLPLARVQERSAPYLHEIVHVLVPSRGDCVWLTEGLASYLESRVAETLGGYDAHVFSPGGNGGIDDAARRFLDRSDGAGVLPFVGAHGQPPGLEEDRRRVARPFYVLSQSFVRHLADGAGLDTVVRAAADQDPLGTVARLSGRSVDAWRQDWLAAIGGRSRAARRP
jgi:hypothetical protein